MAWNVVFINNNGLSLLTTLSLQYFSTPYCVVYMCVVYMCVVYMCVVYMCVVYMCCLVAFVLTVLSWCDRIITTREGSFFIG